jgi:5-methyltetrahydrofolate corrinoid/iron sulfur protein methyltransferase
MNMSSFITVGENIHCTRVVKSGGSRTDALPGGGEGVAFKYGSDRHLLPIPSDWAKRSPVYADGNIRHIALAVFQATQGADAETRKLGELYLQWAADRQIKKGATFLDVNVDEYTNDAKERSEIMTWLAGFLSKHFETPLSIDSSNVTVLDAGLSSCRKERFPMVNSVSLEREEAVDVVLQYQAEAIVSAAGKTGLPTKVDDRLANFRAIIEILEKKGMPRKKMHLDPLVFPISVDPMNGKNYFDATKAAAAEFAGANLTGGLSNISYGMPNRKLLNMVFTYLFVQAGGTGGIIDPVQMPPEEIGALDEAAEDFIFAKKVLDGTDMFGGDYIQAHRDGKL